MPIAWIIMAGRGIGAGVLAFRGELDETIAELRELEANKHEGEVKA